MSKSSSKNRITKESNLNTIISENKIEKKLKKDSELNLDE